MNVLVPAALVFLASSAVGALQQPGTPVDPQSVNAGTLTVQRWNFSIAAPPGLTWRQTQPQVKGMRAASFMAVDEDGAGFVVSASERLDGRPLRPNAKFAREVVDGMTRSMTAAGMSVQRVDEKAGAAPISGAAAFLVLCRNAAGAQMAAHVYVRPGPRVYTFVGWSDSESEPPEFSDFVSSFRILDEDEIPPPPANPGSSLLFLFAVLGWLFDIQYVRRGGIRPTWRARSLLFVACVLPVVILAVRGNHAAEEIGEIAAQLWMLVFAFWELGRFFVRRSRPVHGRPAESIPANAPDVAGAVATPEAKDPAPQGAGQRGRSTVGWRRLAILLSGLWVFVWFGIFLVDGDSFAWGGFFLLGIAPPALAIGLWLGSSWVADGFRGDRKPPV